jgi:Domain of unknown function (DUF4260)
MVRNEATGAVTGSVRGLMRLEGVGVAAVATLLYAQSHAGWGQFAALFLLPDLSLLAYLVGPRAGALAYNAVHSEVGPLALAALALGGLVPTAALPLAFIWAAHVGFDRALGYGLKYARGFGHTHLGLIGMVQKLVPQRA